MNSILEKIIFEYISNFHNFLPKVANKSLPLTFVIQSTGILTVTDVEKVDQVILLLSAENLSLSIQNYRK